MGGFWCNVPLQPCDTDLPRLHREFVHLVVAADTHHQPLAPLPTHRTQGDLWWDAPGSWRNTTTRRTDRQKHDPKFRSQTEANTITPWPSGKTKRFARSLPSKVPRQFCRSRYESVQQQIVLRFLMWSKGNKKCRTRSDALKSCYHERSCGVPCGCRQSRHRNCHRGKRHSCFDGLCRKNKRNRGTNILV